MSKRFFFLLLTLFTFSILCYSQNFTKEDLYWFKNNCISSSSDLKYEGNIAHYSKTYYFNSGDPLLDSLKYNYVSLILNRAYDINGINPDGNTVEYLSSLNKDNFYLIYKGKYYTVLKDIIPIKSLKGENYRNTFIVSFEWTEE